MGHKEAECRKKKRDLANQESQTVQTGTATAVFHENTSFCNKIEVDETAPINTLGINPGVGAPLRLGPVQPSEVYSSSEYNPGVGMPSEVYNSSDFTESNKPSDKVYGESSGDMHPICPLETACTFTPTSIELEDKELYIENLLNRVDELETMYLALDADKTAFVDTGLQDVLALDHSVTALQELQVPQLV